MDEDDDCGSSGSSTRLNNDESPITHHFGTVPSSVPDRHRVFSSPIVGARSYSLRSTPERERRNRDNNQQQQSVSLLQQLAAVSSERSSERDHQRSAARTAHQRQQPTQEQPAQPQPAHVARAQKQPAQPQPNHVIRTQQQQQQQQQQQPALVTQLTQQSAQQPQLSRRGAQQSTRSQVRRPGTKNYSNDELMSLLQCIRSVLPLGRDMWQIVADLHANNFPHCNRDAQSIQRKYLKLDNEQPGSGNPNMPRVTLLAKEIKEAINVKAGVSNPDLSDFFGEDGGVDEDEDPVDDVGVVEGGTGVAVGANIPSTLEVPLGNRRVSDLSSAGSTATKKKTEQIY
jgi:hypothetical protein